jgi:hypothetical protein
MKPVFGIAKDGNVYFLKSSGLSLKYGTEQDYFVIEVRDADHLVGTLYYVLDAEYVIK